MVKIIIELDEALIEKKGSPENLDAEMGGAETLCTQSLTR